MPPGEGTYLVTINHVRAGDYPAGKLVALGSFFESNSIRVPRAKVPPAYLYVPNVR